ncbi:pilus assembly protein [Alphaproteobacteria bacterium KMM 3653]|uniref:Pilus assembly protein n=1 Tax=Harenicola maris TaxID=2841044 RepID=A0AAP2CRI1_9RHOB|nr:pilus assembly protein [Harenicola maris]
MKPLSLIKARLRAFAEDTRGSLSVEAALIMPLLTWLYVGSFVWFDAFRTQNANLKASYTIADMLSRQTDTLDSNFMEGLNTVFDYLTSSNHPTYLRMTTIQCVSACADEAARDLQVLESYATGGRTRLYTADMASYKSKIPFMVDGDTIILVESFMAYEPMFNVGLSARSFENYIVTRPRFASQLLIPSSS